MLFSFVYYINKEKDVVKQDVKFSSDDYHSWLLNGAFDSTVLYKHLLEVRKLKIGIQETRNQILVNPTYNDYFPVNS